MKEISHFLNISKKKSIDPIALRKVKIVCNFDLSECNRVKVNQYAFRGSNCSCCYLGSTNVQEKILR